MQNHCRRSEDNLVGDVHRGRAQTFDEDSNRNAQLRICPEPTNGIF